jgi:hypothetical protein
MTGKSRSFWLDPVAYANNHGYPEHELPKIEKLALKHRQTLLGAWHEYFAA